MTRTAEQDRIRVSCLASARIRHPDNPRLFGLLINRNYRDQLGVRRLTPVGGKLEVHRDARHTLPDGVRFETTHNSNDLRFNMPVGGLDELVSWLSKRDGSEREIDVLREVLDELGPAEQGPLTADQLKDIKSTFRGYQVQVMDSLKPDVKGDKRTVYFNEVYDVKLPRGIRALAEVALQPDSTFRFASAAEIRQGHLNDDPAITIGRTSLTLLDPRPTLELPAELRA